MKSSRYEIEVDEHENTSYSKMLRRVPPGSSVLELGCASGFLSAELSALGCLIVGVEIDETAAAIASQFCTRTLLLDLDDFKSDSMSGQTFDIILAGDVLEHLKDPARLLTLLGDSLRPTGELVLSVPNVAHASVRLHLLSGSFEYGDFGLLDRTHLRFFTRSSLHELLRQSGFVISFEADVTRPWHGTEIAFPEELLTEPLRELLAGDADADVYQFVVAARSEGARDATELERGEGISPETLLPHELLVQAQARHISDLRTELEHRSAALQAEKAALESRTHQLDEILNSTAWRLAEMCRRAAHTFRRH